MANFQRGDRVRLKRGIVLPWKPRNRDRLGTVASIVYTPLTTRVRGVGVVWDGNKSVEHFAPQFLSKARP